ncbi:MAG: MarR family transcriptional regulator [Ornithinimicrobium sp.]
MPAEIARASIPSPIDWSAEGIETELGWSLQATYTGFARAASPAVASVPGGARGYQVLVAVTTETPSSQLALGRRLGIDKNAMTAVVDALEAHGYVQRRPDPEDRRARRIIPTDEGRTLLSAARSALRAAEDELMAGLSNADQAQLRHLLARVALAAGNAESCLA